MHSPIRIGAVLYDPKVSVIWDIIRDFFEANDCPIHPIFFNNYELQVEALLRGEIDIAWNSPLAWLDARRKSGGKCRAIAMRDTDRDRVSHIVVRSDGGLRDLSDLKGKKLAVGAKDSPQATLIPITFLQRQGLRAHHDYELVRFDVLVGQHGDHVGGELEAFRSLQSGQVDATSMLDLNWQAWNQDGTIDPNRYAILTTTDRFDHCVFTVGQGLSEEQERRWLEVLFSMDYANPEHRKMMDLEGLEEWLPARTTGFDLLSEAIQSPGGSENSESSET